MKYIFYLMLVFLIFKIRSDFKKFLHYRHLKVAREKLSEKQRQEWFQLETDFLNGKTNALEREFLAREMKKRHQQEQETLNQ